MSSGTVTAPAGAGRDGSSSTRGLAFALIYLFAPIFVIVLFSFNDPAGRFNVIWQEFTFDNWLHPFADEGLVDALILSLQIAAIATLVATVLGTFIAIALVRYRIAAVNRSTSCSSCRSRHRRSCSAVRCCSSSSARRVRSSTRTSPLGTTTIVIAQVMFLVSYVAITVRARVRGLDWTLEDAAMDLGASPTRTFFRVTLPLILPGILAAALLAFAFSIDDFIITYFVSGPETTTFPVRIFNQSRTVNPAADQRPVDDDPDRERRDPRDRYGVAEPQAAHFLIATSGGASSVRQWLGCTTARSLSATSTRACGSGATASAWR